MSQPGKKTVPALVFEPPKIDLNGRRSLRNHFLLDKRRVLDELDAMDSGRVPPSGGVPSVMLGVFSPRVGAGL